MREIRIPGIRRTLRISWSGSVDREVDDEILFHLDARAEELMRLGVPEQDARDRARCEYGDIEQSRAELARLDRRRLVTRQNRELVLTMRDDLKYAVRGLLRRPALLFVTTITLSLGIAANAIMFGIVDQLLLRPPAGVAAPNNVKRVNYRELEDGKFGVNSVTTYPILTKLRAAAPAFSQLSISGFPNDMSLGSGTDAQNVRGQLVSGNYFRLLGVRPVVGRDFTEDDDRIPRGEPVVIVSHDFWRSQLGGEASAMGRKLLLLGKPVTVVGVAPRGFSGIDRQRIDIWIPVSAFADETLGKNWYNTANNWWGEIIGRVADGATPEVAAAQATAAYRTGMRELGETDRDSSSVVLSSIIGTRTPNGISKEGKISLWLIGVAAIVLLIACANVANLLIVRTIERRREVAVRLALGVSRGRLGRMLLTESALLALIASAGAIIIALVASRFVQNILLPNIVWSDSVIDARVFAFTLGITLLAMLLAGTAPALQGLGTDVADGLKASSRQVAGGRGRLRFILMLAQAALSMTLLVGAGLFVISLRNVASRQVGIDRDRVLRITMPLSRFGFDHAQTEETFRAGAERILRVRGVTNVAVARLTYPMGGASANGFEVPGVQRKKLAGGGPYNSVVTPGFFATIGAPIVRGRDFTPAEAQGPSRVVIVNEAIAKAYWPNVNPIGQCVKVGRDSTCSEVVGVSATVLQFSLLNDDRAIVYATPTHSAYAAARPGAILVRFSGDAGVVVPAVRKELQSLASTMPYVQIKTYGELLAPQMQLWRLGATMFTVFGVIALVIAAVGLYSVMAYWVSQRTHEIGVRMALGAARGDVLRLVAAQSSRAILGGLVLGGLAAFVASRWIVELLYATSPHDPLIYGSAALVLAAAAAAASIVPARQSTAIDPAQAIRTE